ncbi:hypothetical protein QBC44DRAFT_371146 [Cladorrhinum sp. PSN332]|nr:hypothetical protein QBC44DRAFT_371146 [Cladorrhinum sp. PSN332]
MFTIEEWNREVTRLCRFACMYDYCPGETCVRIDDRYADIEDPDIDYVDYSGIRQANAAKYALSSDPRDWKEDNMRCYNFWHVSVPSSTAASDMITTAAQTASYLYPENQDPAGAFDWWLGPCGDPARMLCESTTATPPETKAITADYVVKSIHWPNNAPVAPYQITCSQKWASRDPYMLTASSDGERGGVIAMTAMRQTLGQS